MARIIVSGDEKTCGKLKREAIALFQGANHTVYECREIYTAYQGDMEGNAAISDVLGGADVLYVVTDSDGYADAATILRIGESHRIRMTRKKAVELGGPDRRLLVVASNTLADAVLSEFWVQKILSPNDLIDFLG